MFLYFFSCIICSFKEFVVSIPVNVLECLFSILVFVGSYFVGKFLYFLEVVFVEFQCVKHIILLSSGDLGDDVSELLGLYDLTVHIFESGQVCTIGIGSHSVNVVFNLFRQVFLNQVTLAIKFHFGAKLYLRKCKMKSITFFFIQNLWQV